MQFEIYQEKSGTLLTQAAGGLLSGGQWRWRLRAPNSKIIANGGESFHKKQDCLDSIDLVRGTNLMTPIVTVDA